MNSVLVSLAVMAGAASAQQITMPPTLNLGSVVMGAVNVQDGDACSSVIDAAAECIGIDIVDTPPDELLACACCAGRNNLYSAYSACSVWLEEEMPSFTSEADAYGVIWPLCSAQAECSSSASGTRSSEAEETSTESDDDLEATATATFTDLTDILPTATSAGNDEDIPTGCFSMATLVESCAAQTTGFLELEYISQAPCFCCRTRGGRVIFNDELDGYASECVGWASTAEPDDVYPVASLYAGFCDNFSDVCDDLATTTTESSAEPTESETETETGDEDEVTETETETETEATQTSTTENQDGDGAGASLRVGAVTALVGAVALLCAW